MEVNAAGVGLPGKGAGLSSKQQKVWLSVIFALVVVIVGLGIAIAVVLTTRSNTNKNSCGTDTDMTKEEREEAEEEKNLEIYHEVQEYINEIILSTNELEESDVVSAYQYYISEVNNTVVSNMLRADLLLIEMGYDTEKTRGDELIAVAIELDDEDKTMNSAALVMTLADYYGKTEVYDKYSVILAEREKEAGVTDMGGEG